MKKVYVASRGLPERSKMWLDLRTRGVQITASWIEDPDEAAWDFTELWQEVVREIHASDAILAYVEKEDFPVRGVLVEVGVAIGAGLPVHVVLPGVKLEGPSLRPLGAWAHHPLVKRHDNMSDALAELGYGDISL